MESLDQNIAAQNLNSSTEELCIACHTQAVLGWAPAGSWSSWAGGLRRRRESPPPPAEEEPGDVFDPQGAASAALLRDLHTALLAAAQGALAAQDGQVPAVAPEKAVLYSVESPPGAHRVAGGCRRAPAQRAARRRLRALRCPCARPTSQSQQS